HTASTDAVVQVHAHHPVSGGEDVADADTGRRPHRRSERTPRGRVGRRRAPAAVGTQRHLPGVVPYPPAGGDELGRVVTGGAQRAAVHDDAAAGPAGARVPSPASAQAPTIGVGAVTNHDASVTLSGRGNSSTPPTTIYTRRSETQTMIIFSRPGRPK